MIGEDFSADPRPQNSLFDHQRRRYVTMTLLSPCARRPSRQRLGQCCIRFVRCQGTTIRTYAKMPTFPPALVNIARRGITLSPLRFIKPVYPKMWKITKSRPETSLRYNNLKDFEKAGNSNVTFCLTVSDVCCKLGSQVLPQHHSH
jgi:hypothetical protein